MVVRSVAFFTLFAFLSIFSNVSAFQETDPAIEWYESFFLEKERPPVEEELRQLNIAVEQASENGDMKGKVKALNEAGLLHLTRTHNYDHAMDFFIKSLAIEDSLDFKEEKVFTLLAIAQVFERAGDFEQSADFLGQALKVNEQSKNVHVLVFLLNKLGRINGASGKIEDAFENYELVLKYKEQVGKPEIEAEALFNIANLYTMQNNYEEALRYHKEALALRRSAQDKQGEALSLNDIGEVYHLMKSEEKALANHTVALKIRLALKDKKAVAESYNNIGVLYFSGKSYQRAIANLLLALDAGQDSQDQVQIRKSYEYLSMSYKETGDFANALKYRELHQAIHDFIQNDKNERQLIATRNRYDLGKKESQIDKLEIERIQRDKEIAAQKKFEKILIVLIALILVIIVLVSYLYILKRRSNKELHEINAKVKRQNLQLQQLNATKDKFFSILGHDLKGPLNSLTSFSSLLINHTDSLTKDEIRALAQDLDKSLKNLFALLENLLEWSRSQTGNIEFKQETFDLVSVLEQNMELLKNQAHNKKITIENESKTEVLVKAHRHSVNTVVRNLVSNAIKFTPEGGRISLSAQRGKGEVLVSITDTGVGMSPDVVARLFRIDTKHSTKGTADEKGTGLGLILCKEFVEKNHGSIGVESKPGKGSVFYFTLPV